MPPLPRKLGRTDARVPPVIWWFDSVVPPEDVFQTALDAGLNWMLIPHAAAPGRLPALVGRAAGWSFVLGIEMESLRKRVVTPFDDKLRALDAMRCAAVMVENPTSAGVKSGWPFHRLGQLRDRGATALFFVDSTESSDAEWIVDQTPAHAVIVRFSEQDQLAGYRLLKLAEELGVAVIGKSDGPSTDIDIRLRAAEPGLTSQILPLPADFDELRTILWLLNAPLTPAEREASWQSFRERVPEPAKPKGAHPPEFGA